MIAYSVAPTPAGSTFAWTVTGTATIDPVAADTESVNITFTDAATYTVTCVVTLAGDADSPEDDYFYRRYFLSLETSGRCNSSLRYLVLARTRITFTELKIKKIYLSA